VDLTDGEHPPDLPYGQTRLLRDRLISLRRPLLRTALDELGEVLAPGEHQLIAWTANGRGLPVPCRPFIRCTQCDARGPTGDL